MTPQEKARELRDKLSFAIDYSDVGKEAHYCLVILIDEIINRMLLIEAKIDVKMFNETFENEREYLENVKHEINHI